MAVDREKMPKLGFGLMRLAENDGVIDMPQVKEMVDAYMEKGFCYFDTAYVYHGGSSETAVREAVVERYPRDSFYLATKLPAWAMSGPEDRDRIFYEQMERCGVDYFDFYLLHSLEDGNNYETYEKYDCFRWALEKKEKGEIRHFGFSFHGTPELLEQVLDRHPELERMLKNVRPEASTASWALRFAGSLDGVMTILSGMSAKDQMEDNLETFYHFEPLTDAEQKVIHDVVEKMQDMPLVQCTACRYCCDGCPAGIQIPDVFRALNTIRLYPKDSRPKMFYKNLVKAGSGKAGDCIGCHQCETVCPQHLPITELLKEAEEKLV